MRGMVEFRFDQLYFFLNKPLVVELRDTKAFSFEDPKRVNEFGIDWGFVLYITNKTVVDDPDAGRNTSVS